MYENEKREERELMAARIKELRQSRGMTQKEISDRLGITQANWSFYERGMAAPSLEVLDKMCSMTGYNMEYLLGRTHTKTKKHRTVYDVMETLSTLLVYSGVSAEFTEDEKLVLDVTSGRHKRMLKFAVKQTLEECEFLLGGKFGTLVDIELNHNSWLREKKAQYGRDQLTDERELKIPEYIDMEHEAYWAEMLPMPAKELDQWLMNQTKEQRKKYLRMIDKYMQYDGRFLDELNEIKYMPAVGGGPLMNLEEEAAAYEENRRKVMKQLGMSKGIQGKKEKQKPKAKGKSAKDAKSAKSAKSEKTAKTAKKTAAKTGKNTAKKKAR